MRIQSVNMSKKIVYVRPKLLEVTRCVPVDLYKFSYFARRSLRSKFQSLERLADEAPAIKLGKHIKRQTNIIPCLSKQFVL